MPSEIASRLDKKRVFILLALYFALQLGLRLLVSNSAELDEAEQLLLTQQLSLGYGSQPPLYSWILSALFPLCGKGLFTLALLKNVLLFGTYSLVFLSAREVVRDENRALVAMLSLLLIPQIFWESQRDLTHSVLGTTVAAATFYAMLRLLRGGRTAHYVWFGLLAGIGIISKYNYAVFLVALLCAAASVRELRPRLADRRMLLSAALILLVAAPHAIWAATHVKATLTTSGKFHELKATGRLASYLIGTKSLVVSTVSFLGLLVPVYALFFYRPVPVSLVRGGGDPYRTLVRRTLGYGLVICVLLILLFKVTTFKDRWMQPLLFATPIGLLTWHAGRFTFPRARGFARLALGIALALLVALPATVLWTKGGKVRRLNAPYDALAAQLRQGGFREGLVIASGRLVGGNLKLFFPESVVAAPEVPPVAPPAAGDRVLVWDATKEPGLPAPLADFAAAAYRIGPEALQGEVKYIEAPYKYAAQRSMRLGYLLVAGR